MKQEWAEIDWRIDPNRIHLPECGIYIRAKDPSGAWGTHDLAHLDADSLRDFCMKKGLEATIGLVVYLFGHLAGTSEYEHGSST